MSSTETQQHPFISYLQQRAEDRAMLAALRRGLGAAPGDPETVGMFQYVVPWINEWYEEADIYMLAALFALHPSSIPSGNMGNHLRTLAGQLGDDNATERRFVQLLRMRRDTLEPRLRQQISILKSKDIPINWHQLIRDVNYWDHPERFVQRRWAGAYWGAQRSESNPD